MLQVLIVVFNRIVLSFDVDQSINHEELDDEDEGGGGKVVNLSNVCLN